MRRVFSPELVHLFDLPPSHRVTAQYRSEHRRTADNEGWAETEEIDLSVGKCPMHIDKSARREVPNHIDDGMTFLIRPSRTTLWLVLSSALPMDQDILVPVANPHPF
jgi:hypothetical protein